MMNCGIDIIEISRIESAATKTPKFLEKTFSAEELEYFAKNGARIEILAGFFAAKEAFSKYMGTGISGFKLPEVSVGHTDKGAPFISFKGIRQEVALSISHDKTTAVAVVCAEQQVDAIPPLKAEMGALVPKRCQNSNKGDFGKSLIVAGSRGMTGAAVLSAYSALRTGSGLVTLATADSERSIAASFYPEIMTAGLTSENGIISSDAMGDILKLAEGKDSIVFGPGLGRHPDITLILRELLQSYSGKIIIDADGLNALSKDVGMLKAAIGEVILTPHPGEMSRLAGLTVEKIQRDRQKVAEAFAKEYGVCLVLKGFETVVSKEGYETFINPTGNPGLATAGTGDVLSGVIAALVGQGLSGFDAAKLGVYIHGLAGDIAKEHLGVHGMIASDVAMALPDAIRRLLK